MSLCVLGSSEEIKKIIISPISDNSNILLNCFIMVHKHSCFIHERVYLIRTLRLRFPNFRTVLRHNRSKENKPRPNFYEKKLVGAKVISNHGRNDGNNLICNPLIFFCWFFFFSWLFKGSFITQCNIDQIINVCILYSLRPAIVSLYAQWTFI